MIEQSLAGWLAAESSPSARGSIVAEGQGVTQQVCSLHAAKVCCQP